MAKIFFYLYNYKNSGSLVQRIKVGWWGFLLMTAELAIGLSALGQDAIYWGAMISILITALLLNIYIDKSYHSKVALDIYYRKIDIVKMIIAKLNISLEEIPYVIDKIELELKGLYISKRIKAFSRVFIAPGVLWVLKNGHLIISTSNSSVLTLLIQIIGVLIMFVPFISDFVDRDYKKMREIQSLLKDIYNLKALRIGIKTNHDIEQEQ